MAKKQRTRLEEGLKVSLAQQRSGQVFGPFETPQEVMKFLDAAQKFLVPLEEHCAKPQRRVPADESDGLASASVLKHAPTARFSGLPPAETDASASGYPLHEITAHE
jgi:hypothetical protein